MLKKTKRSVCKRFEWWTFHISSLSNSARMHRDPTRKQTIHNGCSLEHNINNLCFVCECKSANVRVHMFTQHNEVPEKYQKVWEKKKHDSVSSRNLKIGTNVLNLVYNCKNLKLVWQRKRNRIEWAIERERAKNRVENPNWKSPHSSYWFD